MGTKYRPTIADRKANERFQRRQEERTDLKSPVGKARARKAVESSPAADAATSDVDAFMAALNHPLKKEIGAVRKIICGVSPAISEAIKWKSPSFRTTEFFATVNLRSTDRVQLVFHLGAKVRDDVGALQIVGGAGLMKWLAKDRCLVTVGSDKKLAANKNALEEIVRQWIVHV